MTVTGLLGAVLLLTSGCEDSPAQPADPTAAAAGADAAPPVFDLSASAPSTDTQFFSELGLAFTLHKALRVQARSPEDHELRLVGRPSLEGGAEGRMMLVTREGKTQGLREAMKSLADHWNNELRSAATGSEKIAATAAPRIVENFHMPGDHNLTIVKMVMTAQRALTAPPGSDPGEVHYAEVTAVGYFVTVKPAATGAESPLGGAARPAGSISTEANGGASPVAIVAVFIFESSANTENILDAMIKSIQTGK